MAKKVLTTTQVQMCVCVYMIRVDEASFFFEAFIQIHHFPPNCLLFSFHRRYISFSQLLILDQITSAAGSRAAFQTFLCPAPFPCLLGTLRRSRGLIGYTRKVPLENSGSAARPFMRSGIERLSRSLFITATPTPTTSELGGGYEPGRRNLERFANP